MIHFDSEQHALRVFQQTDPNEFEWIAAVDYLLTEAGPMVNAIVSQQISMKGAYFKQEVENKLTAFRHLSQLDVSPVATKKENPPANKSSYWTWLGLKTETA